VKCRRSFKWNRVEIQTRALQNRNSNNEHCEGRNSKWKRIEIQTTSIAKEEIPIGNESKFKQRALRRKKFQLKINRNSNNEHCEGRNSNWKRIEVQTTSIAKEEIPIGNESKFKQRALRRKKFHMEINRNLNNEHCEEEIPHGNQSKFEQRALLRRKKFQVEMNRNSNNEHCEEESTNNEHRRVQRTHSVGTPSSTISSSSSSDGE